MTSATGALLKKALFTKAAAQRANTAIFKPETAQNMISRKQESISDAMQASSACRLTGKELTHAGETRTASQRRTLSAIVPRHASLFQAREFRSAVLMPTARQRTLPASAEHAFKLTARAATNARKIPTVLLHTLNAMRRSNAKQFPEQEQTSALQAATVKKQATLNAAATPASLF